MNLRKVIPIYEAAKRRGVSAPTLYAAIEDGRLTGISCNGKVMVFTEEVERLELNQRGPKKKEESID